MDQINNKLLFIGESKYQKYTSLFWQLLAIVIIIYCCFHFTDNPVVITVIILFLLLTLRLSGYGIFKVYEDSIQIKVQNVLLPFFSKSWSFAFKDIIAIESNLGFGMKEQALSDISNSGFGLLTWNTIKFRLADGNEKMISTKVFKTDIVKAFGLIRMVSNNKIQFYDLGNAPNTNLLS